MLYLTLGHTFGHAIESYLCGYGTWLHGEAVEELRNGYGGKIYHNVWVGSQMKMWHVQKKSFNDANLPISCPQIPLDDFTWIYGS
ncbi:hypothetical protein ABVN80_21295 [Acinetobacter baumannii]